MKQFEGNRRYIRYTRASDEIRCNNDNNDELESTLEALMPEMMTNVGT